MGQTVIDVFSFILDMKKRTNTKFPLLLFLCSEDFTDTSRFAFLRDRAALLLNMQNLHLLLHLFASVLHTVAYFDAAKFSKDIFYCFCCQTMEGI